MIEQDWIFGFAGGLMIGLGAVIFLLMNGRIMGASGILGGLVDGTELRNFAEKSSFIAGLVGVPFVLTFLWVRPDIHLTTNLWILVSGGILVGLGTRLANGCTSGHGVCGLARLSPRSLVATITFMLATGVTVFVARQVIGG